MHKAIQDYLADLLPLCNKEGLQLSDEREIAYGVQLTFTDGKNNILLNVYYSEKKGISTVIGSKFDNPLKPVLQKCLNIPSVIRALPFHNWRCWLGSDECGKGDYFGPLVVCGFYLEEKDKEKLWRMGVSDSKKLSGEQINYVAKQLYHDYAANVECLVLKPKKYNELYASFTAQKKNLNDLLAWGHALVLDNLLKRFPSAEGVLIDQFSSSRKASVLLQAKYPKLQIMERTNAEQDFAVAAASIIARYQLLQSIKAMERFYKMKFPLGAGQIVQAAAKEFIEKYGAERLSEVAKLHFKNTKNLK